MKFEPRDEYEAYAIKISHGPRFHVGQWATISQADRIGEIGFIHGARMSYDDYGAPFWTYRVSGFGDFTERQLEEYLGDDE